MAAPTIIRGKEHFYPLVYEGSGTGQRVGSFVPFTDSGTIANSCIFNRADSATMSRTLETPTNGKIWTFSTWYKRGNLDSSNCKFLGFSANNGGGYIGISSDRFYVSDLTYSGSWSSTLTYHQNRTVEDSSKWYHFMVAVDTTDSTASDRIKIYIDGERVTSFDSYTAHPAQDLITNWNGGSGTLYIGRRGLDTTGLLDGYMAETNFVDGTALGPDTFGVTDTSTGRWIPKTLTGITYGNSGWRLTYADSSNLGDDTSGNTNDFTLSNITSSNQSTDSPTQNYNTFGSFASGTSATEGNLTVSTGTTNGDTQCVGQAGFGVATGKWYWEAKITTVGAGLYGWKDDANAGGSQAVNTSSSGTHSTNNSAAMLSTAASGSFSAGSWFIDGDYGDEVNYTTVSTNDVLMFAIDLDTGKGYCGKNGTWFNSANPANGTGEIGGCHYANGVNKFYPMARRLDANSVAEYNFGATSFAHTPPTGFKKLMQDNLPETAKGVSDLVIIKNRDATDSWVWQDSLRGTGVYGSTATSTDYATAITDGVQKFLKGGVSIEDNDAVNTSGESYVAYCWNINGGTKTTDTSGDLSVELQANATAGVSIGKFTVSGSGNRTWAHGLSGVPEMGILQVYGATTYGTTYHHEFSTTPYSSGAFLTTDAAAFTSSNIWGSAKPTSTLWTGLVGSLFSASSTYVFYSFRGIDGFSKFGSYVGNGNADGTFVYTGFKPAWVMVKETGNANNWYIWDTKRSPMNPMNKRLVAEGNYAEVSDRIIDFLSNGFKIREANNAHNRSGGNYIYMAFAEHPFVGDGTNPVTAR